MSIPQNRRIPSGNQRTSRSARREGRKRIKHTCAPSRPQHDNLVERLPLGIIITADDFGISPGVNIAVIAAHTNGALTNASLMANSMYLDEAIRLANMEAPDLKLGLHINLTGGKPISNPAEVSNLIDNEGNFKYGTVGLLAQTILRPWLLVEIRREITAQVHKLTSMGIKLTHVDGHHHVHMVPGIFAIVKKLSAENNITRIRVVNESLVHTLSFTKNLSFLTNGGIIKYVLLKAVCCMNNYKTDTYFFSILHSCRITPELISGLKIPKGFDKVEIMLHPGSPEMDINASTGSIYEAEHLASPYRKAELETAKTIGLAAKSQKQVS